MRGDGVDEAVIEEQLDTQLGIVDHEFGDGRPEIERAERHRRVDLQQPFRLVVQPRDRALGGFDIGEDADNTLVIGAAGLRRSDASRGAVQQSHAEKLLQFSDSLAHGGACQAHPPRSLGIAAGRNHAGKGVHGVKLVHIYRFQYGTILSRRCQIVAKTPTPYFCARHGGPTPKGPGQSGDRACSTSAKPKNEVAPI